MAKHMAEGHKKVKKLESKSGGLKIKGGFKAMDMKKGGKK